MDSNKTGIIFEMILPNTKHFKKVESILEKAEEKIREIEPENEDCVYHESFSDQN